MHTYRHTAALHRRAATTSDTTGSPQWRCTGCQRLLGFIRDGRLHVRLRRGHEYLTSLPATASCSGCGTMNTL